jgi:hypothetical protein
MSLTESSSGVVHDSIVVDDEDAGRIPFRLHQVPLSCIQSVSGGPQERSAPLDSMGRHKAKRSAQRPTLDVNSMASRFKWDIEAKRCAQERKSKDV